MLHLLMILAKFKGNVKNICKMSGPICSSRVALHHTNIKTLQEIAEIIPKAARLKSSD